jgi:hypothetical protein
MANDSRVEGDELRSDDPSEAAAREFVVCSPSGGHRLR